MKNKYDPMKVDTKEFELPETAYSRGIDNHVFQGIILQCLAKISGISLLEGNVFDHLIGRAAEGVRGIHAEQDAVNHAVKIKVEVNINYGESIPQKSEEIQNSIVQEITQMTGLHVAEVYVLFKGISRIEAPNNKKQQAKLSAPGDYSDIF